MRRLNRVMMMSGLAVLLALVTATSASAYSTSTTGASGRIATRSPDDPDYCLLTTCLWATDTLTDGHCAQWQKEDPNNNWAWAWYGRSSCSGVEELVAYSAPDGVYRLCRTGIGNCGPINWFGYPL